MSDVWCGSEEDGETVNRIAEEIVVNMADDKDQIDRQTRQTRQTIVEFC